MLHPFVYLFIYFVHFNECSSFPLPPPYFSLSFLALTEVSEPRCLNKIIGVQRVSHTWPDQAEKTTRFSNMMGVTAHRVGL